MGLGALLFIPSASAASYPLFLAALMVLAGGITALQVAANPYVAVLGPPETASSRLNLAQAFNSVGTAIAPWLGGAIILSGTRENADVVRQMSGAAQQAYRVHEASSVKLPYLVIGLALMVLAVAIAMFKLPPLPGAEHHGKIAGESVWKHPQLVLGAIGIFVYVGAEVSIGSYLINYFSQANIGNISELSAAKYVSYYWGGAMIGRFVGSAILQKIRTGTVLGIAALAACLLVCLSILSFGHLAMWSIILVGLFNSVMFPSIFTLGIAELGPLTGDGSGLLIMAIVGGAVDSPGARPPGRYDRTSPRIRFASNLLPVHCLLRVQRVEACSGDANGLAEPMETASSSAQPGFIIGVDIGGTKVAAGLVAPTGEIRYHTRVPMLANDGPGSRACNHYPGHRPGLCEGRQLWRM